MSLSKSGEYFSIVSQDKKIDVFSFSSAKSLVHIDLSINMLTKMQKIAPAKGTIDFRLHGPDFDKKIINEKEMMKKLASHFWGINAIFDESETHIIYPTIFGIFYQDIKTGEIKKILGNEEDDPLRVGQAVLA